MTYHPVTSPSVLKSSVDIQRLMVTLEHYTNGKTSVIVFANGTCVFPPLGAGAISNSISILSELSDHPNFEVREMDDENYVVGFGEYAFGVVFRDDFDRLKQNILSDVHGSTSDEAIVGQQGSPDDHLLIGIMARTRLLEDIANPKASSSLGTTSA